MSRRLVVLCAHFIVCSCPFYVCLYRPCACSHFLLPLNMHSDIVGALDVVACVRLFREGHSSVASTHREREQKFFLANAAQQPQQPAKAKPKRSSSGSSSNGSNGNEKPPQLPPRDTSVYSHELPTVTAPDTQCDFCRIVHCDFDFILSLCVRCVRTRKRSLGRWLIWPSSSLLLSMPIVCDDSAAYLLSTVCPHSVTQRCRSILPFFFREFSIIFQMSRRQPPKQCFVFEYIATGPDADISHECTGQQKKRSLTHTHTPVKLRRTRCARIVCGNLLLPRWCITATTTNYCRPVCSRHLCTA